MRTAPLSVAALAALALLSACGKTTVVAGDNDPTANEIASAPPVKLPPAVSASKAYRCKDNSLVYVDFFNDNVTANVRKQKSDEPIALAAPAAGQAFVGGGYTVEGMGDTVSITEPGKAAQSCKA